MEDPRTLATLRALFGVISAFRRRQLVFVIGLMLLGALAEFIAIGSVLPLLVLIANPARTTNLPFHHLISAALTVTGNRLPRAIGIFGVAIVAVTALRLLVLWASQRFVFALGHDIGRSIFGRMLRQPYSLYLERNPSEVVSGIDKAGMLIFFVLSPLIQGVIASVMALSILALLVAIAPASAVWAAAAMIFGYATIALATGPRQRENSKIVASFASARSKAVQEAIGGLRHIILDHSQPAFEEKFNALDDVFRKAQSNSGFINIAPRFVVEGLGVLVVTLVALQASAGRGGLAAAIPVLGALALGAQRLLPLLQTIYLAISQFSGHVHVVRDALALLNAPVVEAELSPPRLPFQRDITFTGVSLCYNGRRHVLDDVTVRIPKGARVALAGRTGSGKSSFLDLLMGLLPPTDGEIRIDGRLLDDANRAGWQIQISHVPQSIYLSDASIATNIAFGCPHIDMNLVEEAARRAQLDDLLSTAPEGLNTFVGERGVRLSGGQRQRIAIARAFYKRASLLILDEAMGQLDHATEEAVLSVIAAIPREMTVIIVSHRASVLPMCDQMIELDSGRIQSRPYVPQFAR